MSVFYNIYRKKNQIPAILFDNENKTNQNFINNEPGEIMLYPEKNIFKLSNKEYLFKYPIGQFRPNIIAENKEICQILLKDNLNYITKFNISKEDEYFLIYEKEQNHNKSYYMKNKDKDDLLENKNIELEEKLLDDN